MQIKINERILSIPPYISTSWSNIAALHTKDDRLCISLHDDNTISIPNLDNETVELIFTHHATYLESNIFDTSVDDIALHPSFIKNGTLSDFLEQTNLTGMQIGFGSHDGIANATQHNPTQADAPSLPQEILEKIVAITKILKGEETLLSESHPLCNCFHCQISRSINPVGTESEQEEQISDCELKFQQWSIEQTGVNLFSVMNRLDNNESYNVFLGEAVKCTCGKPGCEHIVAVLKS